MRHILVVDDEPEFSMQAKIYLEDEIEDLSVDVKDSCDEALDTLSRRDYDAIVSDYMMEPMDGLEFLQALREEERETPFILFTGAGDTGLAKRAYDLGADGYIEKDGKMISKYESLAETIMDRIEKMEEKEGFQPLSN